MKICMVFYDILEFGGLEEYATTLAVGLQQRGHQVSVLSAAWVPPDNQYLHRLREHHVPLVHMPKWLSLPASDWPTKEKILARVMMLLTPLVWLLAGGLFLFRRCSWAQALASARGWLQRQLMSRVIGPDRRRPLTRLWLNWWRWRWRPDLLHIHGYTRSLLFVIDWAHAKNLPVVYEEHQTPDAQFDWWQGFQHSINKATRVVAVSQASAEALRTVCGVTRPVIVRNPLLPDPAATGWQRETRPKPPGEPIYLTTVARLYVTKGLNYLLEAMVQVRAAHPNARFRVFGDGPLRPELLAQAQQLGLNGQEIFVGPFNHQDLPGIMAQTDIFVMSSILEGQPLAVVEAMAYGCPIVTTAVGGIPELIEDGVNGLLCHPGQPSCLAEKITTLIENAALRAKLGHAARRSFRQSPFQPASVCHHFNAIYREALQPEQFGSRPNRGDAPSPDSIVLHP